ncbi:MAG: YtxH domain-containing protein [Candidatus Limnocylindria bacterium]
MFSRVRIAIRFFFVGLAVGVLLAPRSGEETRRLVREKADRLLNDVLDAATLGTASTSNQDTSTQDTGTDADEPAAPKRSRSNGGRSRTRATSPSTASS